jgi:hypothetical protein
MSSRPQFNPTPVFTAVTGQSMATSLISLPTIILKLSLVSYGVSWTGSTPVGALSVQVSNDYSQNAAGQTLNAGTWNTVPFEDSTGAIVTSVAVTGNTGNGFINIRDIAAYAVRLVYTATSGTGTISAIVNAKVA